MKKKQIDRLLVTYPRQPGFTLLAYQIVTEISKRFNLTGAYQEDLNGLFTVTLDEVPVYTCNSKNLDEVDRKHIVDAVEKTGLPVTMKIKTARKRVSSNDTIIEEYPDCFCSGE